MNYAGFANTDTTYDTTSTVSSAADILVNLESGGQYTFPATTEVNMSNNTKQTFGVTWLQNVVTISTAGSYTYYGTINGTNIKVSAIITVTGSASPTELKSTVIGAKLFAYLTPAANIVSTENAAVKLHDGVTANNCVYFSSEAMRKIGVAVSTSVCSTHQYLSYLTSNSWSKTVDITKLAPGSICFTTNDGTGYSTHTFVFMGWVNAGDYTIAYVADNQGSTVHTRSMLATAQTDAFAFFMHN